MSSEGGGGERMIPIDQLSLQELSKIQKQVEGEVEFFGESLGELGMVESKFRETRAAVEALRPEHAEREVLVPLTSSMYVRGRVERVDTVLVELGTGYLAEMPLDKAAAFFQKKQGYLAKQMDTVKGVLQEKQRTKAVILAQLQAKVSEAVQAQGPPSSPAAAAASQASAAQA